MANDTEEREEEGISIAEIFSTIFSKKWLALILVVAITIVGTVAIYFGFNRMKKEYSVSFLLNLPDGDENLNYYYPDGTAFRYTDVISLYTMNEIINTDEAFSDIDVEGLAENGDISIVRNITELTGTSFEISYTIKAKAKYFSSRELARDFIFALACTPGDYLSNMKVDYDAYLTASQNATDYGTQISYLQSQTSYIKSLYDFLIESYSGNLVVNADKTLSAYKSDIDVFIANGEFSKLSVEARDNGYIIKTKDSLAKYESQLSEKARELERQSAALQNLLNLSPDNNSYTIVVDANQIAEQTNLVKQLEQELADLNRYIEFASDPEFDTKIAAFDAKVVALEEQVKKFTEDYSFVAQTVYKEAATEHFIDPSIVVTDGGMGFILSAVISFVAGLIIAAVVAYIAGRIAQKKGAQAISPVVAEERAFAEAEAQAAVSDEEKDKK